MSFVPELNLVQFRQNKRASKTFPRKRAFRRETEGRGPKYFPGPRPRTPILILLGSQLIATLSCSQPPLLVPLVTGLFLGCSACYWPVPCLFRLLLAGLFRLFRVLATSMGQRNGGERKSRDVTADWHLRANQLQRNFCNKCNHTVLCFSNTIRWQFVHKQVSITPVSFNFIAKIERIDDQSKEIGRQACLG